jgi:hypothetical protein
MPGKTFTSIMVFDCHISSIVNHCMGFIFFYALDYGPFWCIGFRASASFSAATDAKCETFQVA